jgi:hypothetical protein
MQCGKTMSKQATTKFKQARSLIDNLPVITVPHAPLYHPQRLSSAAGEDLIGIRSCCLQLKILAISVIYIV